MPKIILFNGPPRSGKDYATNIAMTTLVRENIVHLKLSDPLKDLVASLIGKDRASLEHDKDTFLHQPFNSTYRDLQIGTFNALSKVYGENWLGHILVNKIKELDEEIILISDAGRNTDVLPLIKAFGIPNILVIQLMRKGCSFDYDVRNYIDDPRINKEIIFNDGTEKFNLEIKDTILSFIANTMR